MACYSPGMRCVFSRALRDSFLGAGVGSTKWFEIISFEMINKIENAKSFRSSIHRRYRAELQSIISVKRVHILQMLTVLTLKAKEDFKSRRCLPLLWPNNSQGERERERLHHVSHLETWNILSWPYHTSSITFANLSESNRIHKTFRGTFKMAEFH